MIRAAIFLPLSFLIPLFLIQTLRADVQTLPALPAMTTPNAVQVDASGNIYIAGSYLASASVNAPSHAFVAKLSPDGTQTIWFTKLAGSASDGAQALALGTDNSVYVTGYTESADFPTTPGSMQPVMGNGNAGFVAKLSSNGGVVYATFMGGAATADGEGIAADAAGDAFVTGITNAPGFPTTAGAIAGDPSSDTGFVLELNPQGSAAVVAIRGLGGRAITVDSKGFIYAAGGFEGPGAPVTPGAFQSTSNQMACAGGFISIFPCLYQHIAKIDPTGTQLIYGTYIAGEWGAIPYGIAVDQGGEVIVAGSTNGNDYPVTPGAYQSIYSANPNSAYAPPFTQQGPVSAGYVTKLNSTGTGLLWSSYFGGSGTSGALAGGGFTLPSGDNIFSMAIDTAGNIVIAGYANSSDLPGLASVPVASRPSQGNTLGFIARFTADGGKISATQLISKVASIAVRGDGSVIAVATQPAIVTFPADGRVYAIADPADNARVVNVAPGELLTLYGTNFVPSAMPLFTTQGFPATLDGVTVTFNGIVAPILFLANNQINVQVPYEVSGQTQVTMQVSSQMASPPFSESYILGVVTRQPSVFLAASNFAGPIFGQLSCNGQTYSGVAALAYNADGSLNSCSNPAPSATAVSIFLNGAGVTVPALSTGSLNTSPPVAITPAVAINAGNAGMPPSAVISTVAAPGSISSVVESTLEISLAPAVLVPLNLGGVNAREQNVLVWVRPVTASGLVQ